MRAIILAAGRGSRLGPHTADRPKCLVELGGRPLLAYQLEALREVTDDIVVVRGYAAEKIDLPDVRYVENPDFATRNTVDSLMKARAVFEGDCLVCYSDLVYEARLVKELAAAPVSIGVAVDVDYVDYWRARWGAVCDDNESLVIDRSGAIRELGRPNPAHADIDGRFIGMFHFDADGASLLKAEYDAHARAMVGDRGAWYQASRFHAAAMTDLLQAVIDRGVTVSAVALSRGWVEVDTSTDHRLCQEWIDTGEMSRYCTCFTNVEASRT